MCSIRVIRGFRGCQSSQISKDWHSKCHSLIHRTAIAVCLGTGLFFAFRAATPDARATAAVRAVTVSETVDAAVTDAELTTCNIEDIRLGQRVVGTNPLREQTQAASDIDPGTWRAVRLSMIQGGVEYDLAFLRPVSWIEATGAEVGGSIHMELHEMGLDGQAKVIGIDACPQIETDDGTGRNVVTGTMAHPGANILYLDITGLDEPLGVTDTHPIWSETRQDFVVAGQLEVGEQFRTLTGDSATLTKIHPHRGPPQLVFNLEVDAEHVYSVAGNGLLVHNDCDDEARAFIDANPKASMFEINVAPDGVFSRIGNVPGFDGSQKAHAFAAMADAAGDLRVYDRFSNGMLIDDYLDAYRKAQTPELSWPEFIENIRVGFPVLNGRGGLSPITGR